MNKRHWGPFTGTELDLQLRWFGVTQIVLDGISSSIGVESTARSAFKLSYHLVLFSDATTAHRCRVPRARLRQGFPVDRRDRHDRRGARTPVPVGPVQSCVDVPGARLRCSVPPSPPICRS
ncbi:isochorismatase family protein [Streptomyces sp. NPDC001840]